MTTDTTDLKIKYPTSKYQPDCNCPKCGGKGEREVRISIGEFGEEKIVTVPCICIFVEHKFAKKISPVIEKWARGMRKELERERE